MDEGVVVRAGDAAAGPRVHHHLQALQIGQHLRQVGVALAAGPEVGGRGGGRPPHPLLGHLDHPLRLRVADAVDARAELVPVDQ